MAFPYFFHQKWPVIDMYLIKEPLLLKLSIKEINRKKTQVLKITKLLNI